MNLKMDAGSLACTALIALAIAQPSFGHSALKEGRKHLCFSDVRSQSNWAIDKEAFKKSKGFELLLTDLYAAEDITKLVRFFPDSELSGPSLRSLVHARLYLAQWGALGCFQQDPNFARLMEKVNSKVNIGFKDAYPEMDENGVAALAYMIPWHAAQFWPLKPSQRTDLAGFLGERYPHEVASRIEKIWNAFGISILFKPEDVEKEEDWAVSVLGFLGDEFARFENGKSGRLRSVIPQLRIISVSLPKDGKSKSGSPLYHGPQLAIPVGLSKPATAWLLWHEIGHSFDKVDPSNSEYIARLYCSQSKVAENAATSFERMGDLLSFGIYDDYFTSEFSPDAYRREKNFELASYRCKNSQGNIFWSESLRQSHYNRAPAEQIADDFAHFIMYPARFFYEGAMTAPATFKHFEGRIGTNYLDSFEVIFRSLPSHVAEQKSASELPSIYFKYANRSDDELAGLVNEYFSARIGHRPIP